MPTEHPSYWRLRRASDYIETNLAYKLSVAKAAGLSGLSPSHFGRAFKASTGIPLHRWLLQARVERAQQLLADGKSTIAGISQQLGFADQSHFTRVFKRLTGMTPARWQQENSSIATPKPGPKRSIGFDRDP